VEAPPYTSRDESHHSPLPYLSFLSSSCCSGSGVNPKRIRSRSRNGGRKNRRVYRLGGWQARREEGLDSLSQWSVCPWSS